MSLQCVARRLERKYGVVAGRVVAGRVVAGRLQRRQRGKQLLESRLQAAAVTTVQIETELKRVAAHLSLDGAIENDITKSQLFIFVTSLKTPFIDHIEAVPMRHGVENGNGNPIRGVDLPRDRITVERAGFHGLFV